MAKVQDTVQVEQESFFYDQDELDRFIERVREVTVDYEISDEKVERLIGLLRQTLTTRVPEKREVA